MAKDDRRLSCSAFRRFCNTKRFDLHVCNTNPVELRFSLICNAKSVVFHFPLIMEHNAV